MFTASLIAAEFNGTVGNTNFWDTGLGKMLGTAMGVVGIIVVVYAILKTVKNIASGKVGDAVKGIVGAVILASVLFNPTLIESAIKAGGTVVQKAIETVSQIGGSGGSGGTPGTGTGGTTPTPTAPPAVTTPPADNGGGGLIAPKS